MGPTSRSWSHTRWQVETALAHLNTTMPREVLRGKTVAGVWKELPICALADNLVRLVMGQSASLPHLGVERISCVDALRGLGAPSPGSPLSALRPTPIRPQRLEPRAKKRRPKSCPCMITPRHELRRQLVQHERSG